MSVISVLYQLNSLDFGLFFLSLLKIFYSLIYLPFNSSEMAFQVLTSH